jgi:hypothetical protein
MLDRDNNTRSNQLLILHTHRVMIKVNIKHSIFSNNTIHRLLPKVTVHPTEA